MQMNFQLNVLGLQHIGIPTQVFEETVDFYKSLGFEPYYNARISESNFRVAFLRMGKITIEVYETKNTEHKVGPNCEQIEFSQIL